MKTIKLITIIIFGISIMKEDFVSTDIGLRSYKTSLTKKWIVIGVLIFLLIAFMVLGLSLGAADLSFVDTIKGLFGVGSEYVLTTIFEIRMPRVLGAVLAGAGLSLAGAVMQSCLNNPLASPTTIGVSSAATFGANVAIIGISAAGLSASIGSASFFGTYGVTICAFGFALLASLLILLISKFQHFSPESIILAGTALSALFGAGTTLLQYFGDDEQIAAAVFWTFGDLGGLYWTEIIIISVVLVVCFIFFMSQAWNYNTLVSGEEASKSLGLKTSLIRILGLIFASLLTAVIVSFVGVIGFLGLAGPHIIRKFVGQDHRFFLPASMLTGSIILILADTLSRMVISPVILPIGAITSIIGSIIFIIVLIRGIRKR